MIMDVIRNSNRQNLFSGFILNLLIKKPTPFKVLTFLNKCHNIKSNFYKFYIFWTETVMYQGHLK